MSLKEIYFYLIYVGLSNSTIEVKKPTFRRKLLNLFKFPKVYSVLLHLYMTIQNKILNQCFNSFIKFGVKSVSMDDIARSLGISKKTIYSHFDKKDGLVMETVKHFVANDEKEILDIKEESIDAIDEIITIARHVLLMLRRLSTNVVFDLQKYYPEVWKIVDHKHYHFIFNIIKDNIERGIKEGNYRSDINPDIVAKFYVNLSHNVVDQEKFPLSDYDRSTLYKELVKYHLNSILSPKGKEYLLNQEII